MLKMLVLQQWHGLSDRTPGWRGRLPGTSLPAPPRIPRVIPDYTTVRLFRERLIENGKLEKVGRAGGRWTIRAEGREEGRGRARQPRMQRSSLRIQGTRLWNQGAMP
ncbi:MAG: transposase [Candidatus Methanosuratus sp.]|nr:transposase [Candidatus Methanosuratincola sp.]